MTKNDLPVFLRSVFHLQRFDFFSDNFCSTVEALSAQNGKNQKISPDSFLECQLNIQFLLMGNLGLWLLNISILNA